MLIAIPVTLLKIIFNTHTLLNMNEMKPIRFVFLHIRGHRTFTVKKTRVHTSVSLSYTVSLTTT